MQLSLPPPLSLVFVHAHAWQAPEWHDSGWNSTSCSSLSLLTACVFVAQRFLRCVGGGAWGLWLHFGKLSDDALEGEEQIHNVSSGKGSARWLTTCGFSPPMWTQIRKTGKKASAWLRLYLQGRGVEEADCVLILFSEDAPGKQEVLLPPLTGCVHSWEACKSTWRQTQLGPGVCVSLDRWLTAHSESSVEPQAHF